MLRRKECGGVAVCQRATRGLDDIGVVGGESAVERTAVTDEIDELTAEITIRVTTIAPSLLAIVGCGALTAAKIVGETAHAGRFPLQRRIRPSQWHRAATSVVIEQATASLVAQRESATQHGTTPHALTKHGSTYQLVNCSTGAKTTATAVWKPSASSNAGSPTSSTEPCSPTKPPHSRAPLDRGARV